MNRSEVKKLLRRRDSLLDLHGKLEDDSNDQNNSNTTNGIYKNTRNTINNTLLNIDTQLLRYVKESPVGEWLLQIKGVTPDLAAGLIAYFNIKNKDCAAQFIKYSGADNYNNPHNNNVRKIMDRLKDNFKSDPESWYGRLNDDKFIELLKEDPDIALSTAHLRADRYMRKVFISHLFEEMYREYHDGKLPNRYNDNDCIIIEPEIPYTK